jgi:hypothetical protein
MNVNQKPLFGLKNVFQKPYEALKGFGSGFIKLHAKLDAGTSILPSISDNER